MTWTSFRHAQSEVRFPIMSREGVRQALAAVEHVVGGS